MSEEHLTRKWGWEGGEKRVEGRGVMAGEMSRRDVSV